MGPLFSALIIVPVLLALLALAFIVARVFHPSTVAFRVAAFFVSGAVIGVGLVVIVFALLYGGGTLVSTAQVIGYLSALALGGLFGGVFVLWASIKLRVLTLRSSGTALKRRAPYVKLQGLPH
jgi:hypothetical protein